MSNDHEEQQKQSASHLGPAFAQLQHNDLGGVTADQVKYYVDLMEKVRQTPEWKKFMEDGAFNTTAISGKEYADWVAKAEQLHYGLMKEANFLAPGK